jgi:hypothetical protein
LIKIKTHLQRLGRDADAFRVDVGELAGQERLRAGAVHHFVDARHGGVQHLGVADVPDERLDLIGKVLSVRFLANQRL